MPHKVLIVVGSVRKGRVADRVLEYVLAELDSRPSVETTVADLKQLQLPFFDSEVIPSDEAYDPQDQNVKRWRQMVTQSDSVLFVTPEYNHTLSAAQKNSIDWLYYEWHDKPLAAVAYGWYGGEHSLNTLELVAGRVKAKYLPAVSKLYFKKDIEIDGSLLDQMSVKTQISTTIDQILAKID